MDINRRGKNSKAIMKLFKFSMIMCVLCAIMYLAISCMSTQDKLLLDASEIDLIQYDVPKDDATVVIFETTKGTMKAVIYEDEAPDYCKYFKSLVKDGYYDDTYYFYIEDEAPAYSMGGAKDSDGDDTDDTDTTTFEIEKSNNMWPFKGALATFGGKKGIFKKRNLAGSRLMFINSVEFDEDFIEEIRDVDGNEELIETFIVKGGVPNFSQQFTIFGQIYEGFDTLESITTAEIDDKNHPKEEIKIIKAYLSTYGENRCENESEFFCHVSMPKSVDSDSDSSEK